MCDQVINRDTGEEINTRAELLALVGESIFHAFDDYDPDPMDCCLCNTETEAMLRAAGYAWDPIYSNTFDMLIYKKPTA